MNSVSDKENNSNIKRYVHRNLKGQEVLINNLYRDEMTGIFYVRIYHDGHVRTRSLETDNFVIAKSRISEKIREITNEVEVVERKLVKEYFVDLIKIHEAKGTSEASLKRYMTTWRLSLEPFWGGLVPSEIDQQKVAAYIKWQKQNRGTQLFSDFKVLGQIFRLIVASGESIKAVSLSLPKAERLHHEADHGTYISKEEIQKILEATDQDVWKLVFELAYTVGMRKGECISLHRSYLVKKSGNPFVELPAKITKTRKARLVPLTDDLYSRLVKICTANDGFLLPKKSDSKTHIPPQLADRAWRIYKRKAGIRRRIRFHDLRHTCATNLAKSDADPVKASTMLGMSVKVYLKVYVKKNELNLSSLLEGTAL